MRIALVLVAVLFGFAGNAEIVLRPLVTGLERPVQVVSANDHSGRLFIAEQTGRVLVLEHRDEAPRSYADLSSRIACCDNGGLLSIVFHPQFAANGYWFALYVNLDGDTVLARYTRDDLSTAKTLFVVPQPKDNVPNHHGGTLQFGADGFLYVSIGDGGAYVQVTNRAQELDHLLGKILRIDVDRGDPYAIPADNPFNGVAGARPEIWSYGLRNPWRFSFDRLNGDLLLGDVGQDSWEEIDILTLNEARGANFGWPRTEGKHCFPPNSTCNAGGITLPVLEYPHARMLRQRRLSLSRRTMAQFVRNVFLWRLVLRTFMGGAVHRWPMAIDDRSRYRAFDRLVWQRRRRRALCRRLSRRDLRTDCAASAPAIRAPLTQG